MHNTPPVGSGFHPFRFSHAVQGAPTTFAPSLKDKVMKELQEAEERLEHIIKVGELNCQTTDAFFKIKICLLEALAMIKEEPKGYSDLKRMLDETYDKFKAVMVNQKFDYR